MCWYHNNNVYNGLNRCYTSNIHTNKYIIFTYNWGFIQYVILNWHREKWQDNCIKKVVFILFENITEFIRFRSFLLVDSVIICCYEKVREILQNKINVLIARNICIVEKLVFVRSRNHFYPHYERDVDQLRKGMSTTRI